MVKNSIYGLCWNKTPYKHHALQIIQMVPKQQIINKLAGKHFICCVERSARHITCIK